MMSSQEQNRIRLIAACQYKYVRRSSQPKPSELRHYHEFLCLLNNSLLSFEAMKLGIKL